MLLRHRCLRPLEDVGDELLAIGQRLLATVDVPSLLLVHQEQVIAAGPPGNVNVLADLDVAFGAKNRQSHVTPGSQSVGSEPVDADVAGPAIAAQHYVAEIVEPRVLRVVNVTDLRGNHVSLSRAGEEQELVDLVRTNVADDATVALVVEEPGRPLRGINSVRPQPNGLHDSAYSPGLYQFPGSDSRTVVEPFAVHDGVDAPGM